MRNFIILITVLFCTVNLAAQVDSIKLVYPGVLTEVSFKVNTSSDFSYQRTLNWINETYKNPDRVLVGKKEGHSVTISGYSENACYSVGFLAQSYDISYHLYITITDSLINYKMVIDDLYYKNKPTSGVSSFFNNKGEYRLKFMNVAKSTLEATVNNILFSYYDKLMTAGMTSNEALTELNKYKNMLDLELITQDEYNAKKAELIKYIK